MEEQKYVLSNFLDYLRDRLKANNYAYIHAVSTQKVEMAAREAECFEIFKALEDTLKAAGWKQDK